MPKRLVARHPFRDIANWTPIGLGKKPSEILSNEFFLLGGKQGLIEISPVGQWSLNLVSIDYFDRLNVDGGPLLVFVSALTTSAFLGIDVVKTDPENHFPLFILSRREIFHVVIQDGDLRLVACACDVVFRHFSGVQEDEQSWDSIIVIFFRVELHLNPHQTILIDLVQDDFGGGVLAATDRIIKRTSEQGQMGKILSPSGFKNFWSEEPLRAGCLLASFGSLLSSRKSK